MKRTVLYLLFALMLVGCGSQPQTLGELRSEYVTIDDSVRVHYKIWNESADAYAETICFVHGFGCDMNTWEKQFEAFREEKDLKLMFIDLPGYGQSDKPHVEYTLDFFAHAIDEVLNANDIKCNVVFVGHSLGTPVCRHTITTTHHKGALVDVDGVYCFYDGTETPEYVEAVNQFGHAFDGPDCRDVITGFVSSLAGKETPQEITNYAMSVMPETPQYVASSTMQHLVERKWWPNKQLTFPVMVICTQNSGLDPDNKEKMQRLYPFLNYTELTTCGHFIHMEQPDMFNEKLKDCIKRNYFTHELNRDFFTDAAEARILFEIRPEVNYVTHLYTLAGLGFSDDEYTAKYGSTFVKDWERVTGYTWRRGDYHWLLYRAGQKGPSYNNLNDSTNTVWYNQDIDYQLAMFSHEFGIFLMQDSIDPIVEEFKEYTRKLDSDRDLTYVPWSAFESLACWYNCKIAGRKTADYHAFGEADVKTFCQIFDSLSKDGISDPAELYRKGVKEYLKHLLWQ